jgi:hypothetical protein
MNHEITTPPDGTEILGAQAFAAAMTSFIAQAPHEWWMCGERFDDWPLEQPEVSAALVAFSRAHTRAQVRIFAKDFGYIERHGARFMQWRRLFSHQISVHRWPDRLTQEDQLFRGLIQPRAAITIAAYGAPGQLKARWESDAAALSLKLERLESVWLQGSSALPATTLGL